MGGNLINYPDDCGTPTADLISVKLMLNSVISTMNAKFMTIDLKDFYLMTPMARYEYFRMKLELFPDDIILEYNLQDDAPRRPIHLFGPGRGPPDPQGSSDGAVRPRTPI